MDHRHQHIGGERQGVEAECQQGMVEREVKIAGGTQIARIMMMRADRTTVELDCLFEPAFGFPEIPVVNERDQTQ